MSFQGVRLHGFQKQNPASWLFAAQIPWHKKLMPLIDLLDIECHREGLHLSTRPSSIPAPFFPSLSFQILPFCAEQFSSAPVRTLYTHQALRSSAYAMKGFLSMESFSPSLSPLPPKKHLMSKLVKLFVCFFLKVCDCPAGMAQWF